MSKGWHSVILVICWSIAVFSTAWLNGRQQAGRTHKSLTMPWQV
jgi:hypothetical protein